MKNFFKRVTSSAINTFRCVKAVVMALWKVFLLFCVGTAIIYIVATIGLVLWYLFWAVAFVMLVIAFFKPIAALAEATDTKKKGK